MDTHYSFYKIAFAIACIKNGAKFYACNPDAFDKVGDRYIPGAGCMIKPIEEVTGVKAVVMGKPNKYAIEVLT